MSVNSTFKEQKILVLGIGNEILMDDGIGPKLVRKLIEKFPSPDIKYEITWMGGLDILEFIQGYQTVVFIDAIKTKDGIPGTVYQFTTSDFKETLHLSSLHDVSFLTAIEMGGKIGLKIPENIHIIAIEIVEDTVFGESFSPELQEKYDEIFNSVKNFMQSIQSV